MNTPVLRLEKDLKQLPVTNPRTLIVDDEEVVLKVVKGFLTNEKWECDTVLDQSSAWDFLNRSSYSVLICDVNLPGNSTEFVAGIKERYPSLQIIMFTGDPSIHSARLAIQQGVYDYIPKPCRREDMVHIVKQAHEKYLLLEEKAKLEVENETYRQQLEEMVQKRTYQLRESELRYRAFFNCAVDAIFLVDSTTRKIFDSNAAAAQLVELRNTELIDKPISDFLGDQIDQAFIEYNKYDHAVWRFQNIILNANGELSKHVQVFIGKVVLEDRSLLQLVARDVTDQIKLKEHKEIIESELLNEQRLASIGLLASGVAHNINTPLMGIYGVAQIIKMKHPELEDIDGVITQVERINGIIRNLMWKSRQEQDQSSQEIDLNQLLKEELQFLEADMEFKHNVEKNYNLSNMLPTIIGKYSDFSQSFTNIVRNAVDSMYARTIKTLYISSEIGNDDIRISVKDSGCGIRKTDLEKIFIPFYTTKPIVKNEETDEPSGTGLGLSTVQRLLAPYGVRFEIESEPNQGTNFTICIPIEMNSAAARNAGIKQTK